MHLWNRILRIIVLFSWALVFGAQFSIAKESSDETLAKGKDLYLSKCTKCHKMRDPSTYDEEKWNHWMEKMKKKAHLNDEQYDLILRYTESLRKNRI